MDLSSVFGKTWKEYKNNFGSLTAMMLVFYIIPLVIVSVIAGIWVFNSGFISELQQITVTEDPNAFSEAVGNVMAGYWQGMVVLFLVFIIMSLISLVAYAGIVSTSLRKNRFSFRELSRNGFRNWGRFILALIALLIVLLILMIASVVVIAAVSSVPVLSVLVTLVLIVIWIALMVYWCFVVYAAMDKYGVIESFGISMRLVRGNWWRVFGYLIIVGIIIGAVSWAFSLIGLAIGLGFGSEDALTSVLIQAVANQIASAIAAIFITPYVILFAKNMYQGLKAEKKF